MTERNINKFLNLVLFLKFDHTFIIFYRYVSLVEKDPHPTLSKSWLGRSNLYTLKSKDFNTPPGPLLLEGETFPPISEEIPHLL
jgi:hypothetical protein